MKYSVKKEEKAQTIKSTQIINKKGFGRAIMVDYLDGTQDVFELNDDNLNKIEKLAEEQGQEFVSKEKKKLKIRKILITIGSIIASTILVGSAFSGAIKGATLPCIIGSTALLGDIVAGILAVNLKNKEKYLKKYQLYFEQVKDKLSDYQNILEKEKHLTNKKKKDSVKLESVLDLDSLSLSQVESINEKVDRYYKVDRQKIKKI